MTDTFLFCELTVEAPLLLGTLGGDPNTIITRRFIPGSVFRGALARKLMNRSHEAPLRKDFYNLVLNGPVRYLNAYPSVMGRRSLPLPSCLRQGKTADDIGGELALHNTLFPVDKPLIKAPFEYLALVDDRWSATNLSILTRLHIARDRSKGKAWSEKSNGEDREHGTMFNYQYLAPGQKFIGALLVSGEDVDGTCEILKQELEGNLLLGRSRRANYGQVSVHFTGKKSREYEWLPLGSVPAGQEFQVVLTSDYIGRDPLTGHIRPSALLNELSDLLRARAVVHSHVIQQVIVGGYNRKWGLQVPQNAAACQGSIVCLTALTPFTEAELRLLEAGGIGERRVEGYGRFVFVPPFPAVLKVEHREPDAPALAAITSSSIPKIVEDLEHRILFRELRERIWQHALELANGATHLPRNSLLGRLRIPLRSPSGLQTLESWLAGGLSGLKRPALSQLEACRLTNANSNLADWLNKTLMLRNPSEQDGAKQFLKLVGSNEVVLKSYIFSKELCDEHVQSLIQKLIPLLIDDLLGLLSKLQTREQPAISGAASKS